MELTYIRQLFINYNIIYKEQVLFFMTVAFTKALKDKPYLELYSYADKIEDWVTEFKVMYRDMNYKERKGNDPIRLIEDFVVSKLIELKLLNSED